MYKDVYYVIGNPLESDEYFMDSTDESFDTIKDAKEEIEARIKFCGSRYKDYEIAKVTMIIERGIK